MRRHSRKHIIKLYNKLKNGETLTTWRNWWAEGDNFSMRHELEHGRIMLVSDDWTDRGYMFEYDSIEDFIILFRGVCDFMSPTYYIRLMNEQNTP